MTGTVSRPLVLVGCGKMGGAMLDGWLKSGITEGGVVIVDPYGGGDFLDKGHDVRRFSTVDELPDDLNPEVIILAVKPQQMDDTIDSYKRFAGPDTIFLSIAAGKTIGFFESHLGGSAAVVRAMPNTPAAISQGITVCCPNRNITDGQLALCLALLESVGEAMSVQDESLIDAVTALSGGGPAYVFLLIETMTQAGIKAGLSEDMAARLALVTVAGAGQLALASDDDPAQLRKNVTSPNGTTQEALAVLMRQGNGLPDLMVEAIAAATARSRELAG